MSDRIRPWRSHRGATTSPDAIAVRAAAWLRLVGLVALPAAGSFQSHLSAREEALYLLLGLVWAPWACVVLLAADDPNRRLALRGGPIGDVTALFAVQALLPGTARTVLFGYLVAVVFAGFTAGRTLAGAVAVSSMGLSLLATTQATPDQLGALDLIWFGLSMTALLMLARRSASVHALASARAEGLRTKADVILATVVGGVVVTDNAGRLLQANPAAERLIGSSEPLVGRGCADALGLHVGSRVLDCSHGCALLEHLDPDGAQGQEVWRSGAGGGRHPILASAVTLSTNGQVEVVHSLQDITRLKEAEEAKTLFLATASHELKTPLTVINGFAETLTSYTELDDETRALALGAIRTRARELTRVVDRLLLSSRIEAGRVSLVLREVDIAPLLRERVDGLSQATGRPITCTIEPDLPAVHAEADAFVTVIDHLLENALKYSPGGGSVHVTGQPGNDRTVVTVQDQGIGMDPEQAARCFDKFWQAESSDVRRFGGTGIGLYIVHSLVEAMSGRIKVRSVTGVGTTFTVELLPVAPVPLPREAGQGEATSIREFMRQIGVPNGERR